MAQIGTAQIAGNANAGPAEVELNTLALRTVVRPQDLRYLGSYGIAMPVADTPSSLAQISNIGMSALYNPAPDKVVAIKRVRASLVVVTAAPSASIATLQLQVTRGVTIFGTAGTVLPNGQTTNQMPVKLRSTMPNSETQVIIQASLSAGTGKGIFNGQGAGSNAPQLPTADNETLGSVAFPITANIGTGISNIPSSADVGAGADLFDWKVHNAPIMLGPQDGIEVTLTFGSTTTSVAHVNVNWMWDEFGFDWSDLKGEGAV